jgi:hypothetical protein
VGVFQYLYLSDLHFHDLFLVVWLTASELHSRPAPSRQPDHAVMEEPRGLRIAGVVAEG